MLGVWIDLAGLDHVFDFGNRHLRCRRDHRIEVARGHPVDEVSVRVALPRLDQRQVGDDSALHHVVVAVENLCLLALRDDRTEAGLGIERRNASPACAQPLGERALRRELEFEFAREILPLEFLVLADVGRDHLLDLPGLEEDAEAEIVDSGIVGNDGQVLHACVAHRGDQCFGNAAKAKAADGDRHAVLDHVSKCCSSARIDFIHRARSLPSGRVRPGPAEASFRLAGAGRASAC